MMSDIVELIQALIHLEPTDCDTDLVSFPAWFFTEQIEKIRI